MYVCMYVCAARKRGLRDHHAILRRARGNIGLAIAARYARMIRACFPRWSDGSTEVLYGSVCFEVDGNLASVDCMGWPLELPDLSAVLNVPRTPASPFPGLRPVFGVGFCSCAPGWLCRPALPACWSASCWLAWLGFPLGGVPTFVLFLSR